jgi:hypothetical protein
MVPIGRPVANTTVRVVDQRGRPCPVGVVGDGGAEGVRDGHRALAGEVGAEREHTEVGHEERSDPERQPAAHFRGLGGNPPAYLVNAIWPSSNTLTLWTLSWSKDRPSPAWTSRRRT